MPHGNWTGVTCAPSTRARFSRNMHKPGFGRYMSCDPVPDIIGLHYSPGCKHTRVERFNKLISRFDQLLFFSQELAYTIFINRLSMVNREYESYFQLKYTSIGISSFL